MTAYLASELMLTTDGIQPALKAALKAAWKAGVKGVRKVGLKAAMRARLRGTLKAAVLGSDLDLVLCRAIQVGTLCEMLRIATGKADQHVGKGRKTLANENNARTQKSRKAQDRYDKINRWVAERRKKDPKGSLTYARERAAEAFGVDYSTVMCAQNAQKKIAN